VNEIEATEVVVALFARCHTQLVRYTARSVNDQQLAEDFVQDAFMHLYGALKSGKNIDHPKAWAICILRRAINKELQHRFEHEDLDAYVDLPDPTREPTCLPLLAGYLCLLSSREEEVLLLRLDAMKYREIAEHLGITVNSVNKILARALQKLKHAVEREKPHET